MALDVENNATYTTTSTPGDADVNKLEFDLRWVELQNMTSDPRKLTIRDVLRHVLVDEAPEFKFALREDVQDDVRFLPTKGEPKASGWDVRAAQTDRKDLVLRPGEYFKIPLGFRAFCPEGWWYSLHPRSSSFAKKSLHALIGIIDETYAEQAVWAGQYLPDPHGLNKDLIIKFGDAIGQIVPVKRVEMTVTSITNEEYDQMNKTRNAVRNGGFGSTTDKAVVNGH